MPLVVADRVKEFTNTTGTGPLALVGAVFGYRRFSAALSIGDTCYYAISHRSADEWETGIATYSGTNTLTRTTVKASSNGGAAVNFSAGSKEVFLAFTADHLAQFEVYDADLEAIANLAGTSGLLRKTAANSWALDTAAYLTGNQAITLSGDVSGTGATSITVTLATVPLTKGGTGATDAAGARAALGLGTISTQAANSVSISGGTISGITDLAVADGGTGTSTGSITGTTALVFTAGGTAQPVTLAPSTTGAINLLSSSLNLGLNTGANVTITPTVRTGTGAGASLIFQPGAQVTSGGDGKIIFKAAASGSTQNFWECQNFAGYALTRINSAGNIATDSGITFGTDAVTQGGPFTLSVSGSGTGVAATGGAGFGRDLIISAGASDNQVGKEGGDVFIRGGVPLSPATVYGDIYIADQGGSVSIGSTSRVGKLYVISSAITQKTAVLRKLASQTANTFEQQNESGVVQTIIDSTGRLSNNVGINLGIDSAESGPYTLQVTTSGGATPAPAGTGFGRDLIVKAGDSDNTAGKTSGNLFLRAGTPISPSTTYGNVIIADNGGSVSIGSTSLVSKLFVLSATTTQKTIVARIASGQTVPAFEVQNNAGSALMAILPGGGIQPASMANASAPNNSIYYSTDVSKLVYKDPGGVVNNLY